MALWAGTIAFFLSLLIGGQIFPDQSMVFTIVLAAAVTAVIYMIARRVETRIYVQRRQRWETQKREEELEEERLRQAKAHNRLTADERRQEWLEARAVELQLRNENPEQFHFGVVNDPQFASAVLNKLEEQGLAVGDPNCLKAADLAGLTGVLRIESDTLQDLEGIQYARNLKAVVLSGMANLTSLDPLAELSDLAGLYIDGSHEGLPKISDVRPIAELSSLQELLIGRMVHVDNFHVLASLSNLKKLFISGYSPALDLSVFSALEHLNALQISDINGYPDLSPIATLKNLTTIGLSDLDKIGSLEPLGALAELRALALNKVYLNDPETLADLKSLEDLQMGDVGGLFDLEPIEEMKQLRSLVLIRPYQWTFEPEMFSLKPLGNLPALSKLVLAPRNSFSDFDSVNAISEVEISESRNPQG